MAGVLACSLMEYTRLFGIVRPPSPPPALTGPLKEGSSFRRPATSAIEPFWTNTAYKLSAVLGIALTPFYVAYLWEHRLPQYRIFGVVFVIGEVLTAGIITIGRLMLWHRQERRVCRLDSLSPPFPRDQWPMVHILSTHYLEPVKESIEPLRQAVQLDYPVGSYVVNILDDGYHTGQEGSYTVTEMGREMERAIHDALAALTPNRDHVTVTRREQPCLHGKGHRPEVAPGGSTIIEFHAEGLPLVRLVGRKKGPDSFAKTGNLENALWNVMEEDVQFILVLDSDMAPVPEMLQMQLPPMLEYRGGTWRPDWCTAYTSSPQDFKNIQSIWGASDPMNQFNKFFWRILPSALDTFGLVHFWGTNAAFFVPALRDAGGFVYNCITEDTVTGAQLHRFGWKSTYVGGTTLTLAKGLCRENVLETFDQRKRWAQGNIQQFFMELDPPFLLHESFRNPPYRREFYRKLWETWERDRSPSPAPQICLEDAGSERRRARRTLTWRLLREVAYIPTKWAFLFTVRPIYYYLVTLTMVVMGCPPFHMTGQVRQGFLGSFWVLITYWLANALASFLSHSMLLADPDTAYCTMWRSQQEFGGYAWVRALGIFEGAWSAIMGRQLKWRSFGGGGGGQNLKYTLPTAAAFLLLACSMVASGIHHCVEGTSPGILLSVLFAGFWVLVLLLPVSSCILAEWLGAPYYTASAVLQLLVATMAEVGLGLLVFGVLSLRH